jgi:WhiB family redox-sensing transcriptional regulator
MAFARTLPEVPPLEQWRLDAACASTDPDLFFPIGSTGRALDQIEGAKRVCAICPVSGPCLEFALATNQDSGVWGGRSEDERRVLRRQWLRQRRASAAAAV